MDFLYIQHKYLYSKYIDVLQELSFDNFFIFHVNSKSFKRIL